MSRISFLATVAGEIHDLSYRGKQLPPGHAMAIAALLEKRGMLRQDQTEGSAS